VAVRELQAGLISEVLQLDVPQSRAVPRGPALAGPDVRPQAVPRLIYLRALI